METEKKLETRNEKLETLTWREQLILYAPLFIWIGVILFFSTGQGAASETSRFIRPVLELLFPTASPELITLYHGYIRKLAHFAVYAVLGLLAMRAFFSSVLSRRKTAILALGLCIAVALTDEFIQSFNPLRTGTPYDVALDMAGALIAVTIYAAVFTSERAVTRNRI
jgi:VanZ family protein